MFQSLDLIFEDNYEDTFKDDSPLLGSKKDRKPTELKEKSDINDVAVETIESKTSHRKSLRKSFSTNLDVLFEGPKAVEDTAEKPKDARLAGIDLLIIGTIEGSKRIIQKVAPEKKRVTFIIDKEKLAKIKGIAKSEKAYIKDIFDRVVSEYLRKEGLL